MKKEIAGDTSKAVTCSRNAAKLGYEVTENDEYEGTSFWSELNLSLKLQRGEILNS